MVITEYRSHVERRRANDEPVAPGVELDGRPRDAERHCWDLRPCDHPDHGTYGTIHFIR